jgi:hypothetical protein
MSTGGDTFSNITGATIINRSQVQGAVSILQQQDNAQSAEALKLLADYVEKSGNSEAAEHLDDFTEELQKPEPRKSKLRSAWDSLQKALPAVSQIVGIAGGIAALLV